MNFMQGLNVIWETTLRREEVKWEKVQRKRHKQIS